MMWEASTRCVNNLQPATHGINEMVQLEARLIKLIDLVFGIRNQVTVMIVYEGIILQYS